MAIIKKVKQTIVFVERGDFDAYYKACEWCKENDYSYGSMERDNPIGLMKSIETKWIISKWRNLRDFEREKLNGVMTSSDFRNGPVKITIYEP